MFEQTFVAPGHSRGQRMIFLALSLQTLAVGVLLLIPLLAVRRIEAEKRFLLTPPDKPAVEPAPPEAVPSRSLPQASQPGPRVLTLLPAHVPAYSVPVAGLPDPGDAPPLNFATGAGTGFAAIGGADFGSVSGPAAPPASAKEPAKPVHVSTGVSQSRLEFGPRPTYPQLAVISRTEGAVRLQAIISRTGTIENLHVLSGNPLLVSAAMTAVKQWRYRPLLLNGEPVEVITEIDVNFTLSR